MSKPLCFVLVPVGQTSTPDGTSIDFDRIYANAIRPGVAQAGMIPVRADNDGGGGIDDNPTLERMLLCDYAIADLTTANAGVLYGLGLRDAARPGTALAICAGHAQLPSGPGLLRPLRYDTGAENAFGDAEAVRLRDTIAAKLSALREGAPTGAGVSIPLIELLGAWRPGDLARLKTDVFRERVGLDDGISATLADIRSRSGGGRDGARADLTRLRGTLDPLGGLAAGVLVDVLLTYRALQDWDGLIGLYDDLPLPVQRQTLVREQLAFACNRRASATNTPQDRRRALQILAEVEDEQGPSAETCSLIGRIHKDEWQAALSGDREAAHAFLEQAIAAYLRGFYADSRDAYPGINALTLLDIEGSPDSLAEKARILPVVRFAVEQRLRGRSPDYWDHATLVELAVLDDAQDRTLDHLGNALATVREAWEPASTANNLRMIETARRQRGCDTAWIEQVIAALDAAAQPA